MLLSGTQLGRIDSRVIGRTIIVDGLCLGGLTDFHRGLFRTTLWAGGRVHTFPNSAHIVF